MIRILSFPAFIKISITSLVLAFCVLVLVNFNILGSNFHQSIFLGLVEKFVPKESFDHTPNDNVSRDENAISRIDINSEIIDDGVGVSHASTVATLEHEVDILGDILRQKLRAINDDHGEPLKPTCGKKSVLANSCDGGKTSCMQTQLPDDPRARVQQLVGPSGLRLSPEQHELIRNMTKKVSGFYDIILLTGASSNHFNESQALLETVHERLFPILHNFTMIFYDLGLTSQEKELMVKNCRCQYIAFPFEFFPNFTRELRCYSWKPVMIKAMLQNANIIIWMDASVRFSESVENIQVAIGNARERGIQMPGSNVISAFRTFQSMYHFFGDEPCSYFPMGMAKATFGIYHNELFVDRAILEPWVACALQAQCMCPPDRFMGTCRQSKDMYKRWREQNGPILYGLCHLYDQSAISLILHKLYQDQYRWVYCNMNVFSSIQRDDLASYFT